MTRSVQFTVLVCSMLVLVVVGWLGYGAVSRTSRRQPEQVVAQLPESTTPTTPSAVTQAPADPTVTLLAVGDIMLARQVERVFTARQDTSYPFKKIRDMVTSADLAFANLECPITDGPEVPSYTMRFNCNKGMETPLAEAGFDVLSIANNHMGDWGQQGVKDTVAALTSAGLHPVGGGVDSTAARAPVIVEKQGMKLAFLAFNDHDVVPDSYGATATHAGTNFLDNETISTTVAEAKKFADLVIVSMHSGIEYKSHHSARQEGYAHAAVDAGADLVIGHHPHVAQDVETYKGKYILYSLGNFIFDQSQSLDVQQGLVAHITLHKAGVSNLELSTVRIQNTQPVPKSAAESTDVFTRIGWTNPS